MVCNGVDEADVGKSLGTQINSGRDSEGGVNDGKKTGGTAEI